MALLGTRPARRIRTRRVGIVNQRRDAEIKQLGTPVRIDKYIGRFYIAVDEQTSMCAFNRIDDLGEQTQALLNTQPRSVRVLINALAINQFHRQPQTTIIVASAIEQARDVRMLEFGQNLAFAAEQLGAVRSIGVEHALDSHLL